MWIFGLNMMSWQIYNKEKERKEKTSGNEIDGLLLTSKNKKYFL